MEKKIILEVSQLNKFFKSKKNYKIALDNVSFDVFEGDFLGIIGESGSGKTTLGKTLVRLNDVTSGKIKLYGENISDKKINKKTNLWICKNMQMIFQDPLSSLNPKMNIFKLVSEPIIIDKSVKKQTKKIIEKRIDLNIMFGYAILMELKFNKYEFLKKYFESYKDLININLKKIKEFRFSNDNSWTDSFAELETLYDFFINAEKKIIDILNDMYTNTKEIVKSFDDKLHKNNIPKLFTEYLDSIKILEGFNIEFFEKNIYIKSLKEEIDKINHKICFFKNGTLIKNKLKDIKLNIKINKIDKNISQTKRDFNYKKLLVSKDFLKLNILNDFNKFIYIPEKIILDNFSLVAEKIDTFYSKKFIGIFEQDLIKEYAKKMDNIDYKSLENELQKEISKDLMEINKEFTLTDEKNKILVSNLIEKRKNNFLKIRDTNKEKKSIKKQVNKDPEFIIKKNDIKIIKKRINELKNKNKKEFVLFSKMELNNMNLKIKRELKETLKLKKTLKDEFKRLNKDLLKIRPTDLKNFSRIDAQTLIRNNNKSMKYESRIRFSSLDLLEFEFKKIMEYYFIEEKKCSSNKLKLLFYKNDISKIIILDKVFLLLESVGLKREHAYRYPHEFSGGQRQRIVIARALINNPKIIIADEAISALDVSIQAQVINIMKDLSKKRNVTFLFIAHDLSMVKYVCNKVLIMHNGRIVEKGLTKKIFDNPIHPYTQSLLKAIPELSKMDLDLSAFEDNSNYSDNYSFFNKPKFMKIEANHEVLATEEQFKKWI